MPFLRFFVGGGEVVGILLEEDTAAQHFHSLACFGDADDVHGVGEAVQQLRAQVAFFRVHGADQHKARRVLEADPFTLDHVDAHGGAVQQQVHHVVVEQVDFVYIEHAAIGRGQDARFEVALALLDGLFDVQRADHTIFRGADGQVHKGRGQRDRSAGRLRVRGARGIRRRRGPGAFGSQLKRQPWTTSMRRQQGSQGTRRRGFGRAAFAADQHAADLRVDGIEYQGALHALLSDDRGEWISLSHG